jgi:putative ABC transport system permease protein
LDPYSLDTALADTQPILAVLKADPRVTAAEPMLGFGALYLDDGKSLALQVLGVTADTGFFPKVRSGLEQGAFLPADDSILVSRSLAAFLGLEPGSEVMLLTEDSGGSPYYMAFSLDGLFATDSLDFDDTTVLVGLEAARTMTWLPAGATEVRFTLADRNLAAEFAAGLGPDMAALGASIHDWRYLNAGLLSMVDMMDVFIWVFNLIVIIVAATVITNAILMNVFDRMREFGTLRAIGLRRGRLFRLIMLEGAVLGEPWQRPGTGRGHTRGAVLPEQRAGLGRHKRGLRHGQLLQLCLLAGPVGGRLCRRHPYRPGGQFLRRLHSQQDQGGRCPERSIGAKPWTCSGWP